MAIKPGHQDIANDKIGFGIARRLQANFTVLDVDHFEAVGGNETNEFLRQSRDYAAMWNAQSGNGEYLPLEGFHHTNVVLELGRTGSQLNDAVLAQIGA